MLKKVTNYYELPLGEQEAILDSYIKVVCEILGFTIQEFYCVDEKTLKKLLA
jgi:hypothetical protein